MEDYPSNSFIKPVKEEPKKEMIVSTPAKIQKKSFWENLGDLTKSAAKSVCTDILVPSIQKTVSTMVNNMVDIMIYGEPQNRQNDRSQGTRVSYSSYYGTQSRAQNTRPRVVQDYNYDNIVLNSREDAENVLAQLDDVIRSYGYAKVADLYDFVGLRSKFTDNNYGWTDLRSASVSRCRDGYLLVLPKPMALE